MLSLPGAAILAACLICEIRLCAQDTDFQIEHFSVDKGLSDPVVECMLRHSNGFIYVGTRNGLNRFDGYEFVPVDTDPLLNDPTEITWFEDMCELPDGAIFTSYKTTWSSGFQVRSMALFDPQTGVIRPLPMTAGNGFEGLYGGLCTHGLVTYYYGIDSQQAVVHVLTDSMQFIPVLKLPHNKPLRHQELLRFLGNVSLNFQLLKADGPNGHYFLLDNINGLRRCDLNGEHVKVYASHEITGDVSANISWEKMLVGRLLSQPGDSMRLVIQTDDEMNGAFACDITTGRFAGPPQSRDHVVRIFQDRTGNEIWCLQDQRNDSVRLVLCLRSGKSIVLGGILKMVDGVTDFYSDDVTRSFWIMTQRGLILVKTPGRLFDTYLNHHINDWEYNVRCRAIARLNDDQMIVAVQADGLYSFDTRTGDAFLLNSWYQPDGSVYTSKDVWNLFVESDSIVWTITVRGEVLKFDLSKQIVTPYSQPMQAYGYASAMLHDNRLLWGAEGIGSGYSLYNVFDRARHVFDQVTFKNADSVFLKSIPSFILETSDHSIWVGTKRGCYHVDSDNMKILEAFLWRADRHDYDNNTYPNHAILSASHIMSMCEGPDSTLWIGLEHGGVNILDRTTGVVKVLTTVEGLANNSVCGIIRDSTGFWLMTYSGLSHYNINNGRFRNFYTEDGLTHNEFNRLSYYQDDNGLIYAGGMNGINRFDPGELLYEIVPASLLLCEATYFEGGAATIEQRHFGLDNIPVFTLPSNNRQFSAKVALADYSASGESTYVYALQPQSTLRTTDTPIWQVLEAGRSVHFGYLPSGDYRLSIKGYSPKGTLAVNTLQLAIHVRKYFYQTAWFIGLCIVLILGVAYAIHRYRLTQVVQMERLRAQISSDLHDDVGGVLSGIAYQMELLEYSVEDSQKSLIHKIRDASRNAVSRMRDAVWAIDASQDTFGDLEERMERFASEMLTPYDIAWKYQATNISGKQKLPSHIRHHLLLIFKEFITNTMKHASATEVLTRIDRHGKWLNVYLQDDGVGLSETVGNKGMGLLNMQRRAEKMQAHLEFTTMQGFGLKLAVRAF